MNLKDTLFSTSGARHVANLMGWQHRAQAIGVLALLWHETQAKKMATVTPRDVWLFCELPSLEDAERLCAALVEAGFMTTRADSPRFTIDGNREEIRKQNEWVEKSRRGGLKSKKIQDEQKAELNSRHDATLKAVQVPGLFQDYTRQDITIQEKTLNAAPPAPVPDQSGFTLEPEPEAKTTAKVPPKGLPAWEAYRSAMLKRYGREPIRNAKVNSQAAQLVARLGADAPEVVRFFVGLTLTKYASLCHPLGLCLRDAETLHTQWQTGRVMTGQQAKREETFGATKDAVLSYYQRKHGIDAPEGE